jgi:hypothetical protein
VLMGSHKGSKAPINVLLLLSVRIWSILVLVFLDVIYTVRSALKPDRQGFRHSSYPSRSERSLGKKEKFGRCFA